MKDHQEKQPVCFHCGNEFSDGVSFFVEWKNEARVCCSQACADTASQIIEKGLGDFYCLPRPKISRNKKKGSCCCCSSKSVHEVEEAYFSHTLSENISESFLFLPGLHCSSCAWVVERALKQLTGVVEVGVNALTRRVSVSYKKDKLKLDAIIQCLAEIGYPAEMMEYNELDALRKKERNTLLKQILVAGFGTMQAMMFALVIYVSGENELDQVTLSFFKWLGFLVATPVVLYSAKPFFKGAFKAINNKNLNMDVPIAISVFLTYLASFYQAISEGGEVYFDSVSMLVFLILLGRYLELLSRHKAQSSLESLSKASKPFVERKNPQGEFELVRVTQITAGDVIRVKQGEQIPVDGILLSENLDVDESLITGEFDIQRKIAGTPLLSGCLVKNEAEIRVEKSSEHSFITALQSLSLKAQTSKVQLVQEGEKTASQFVLAVLCFTLLTVAGWLWIDPSKAFDAALAVLVVSCPCAFALATPAVITRSLSVLSAKGILLLKPDALARLLTVDTFVFDKTGTLTDSSVDLACCFRDMPPEIVFKLAASLSQDSQHPLSEAFLSICDKELLEVSEQEFLNGLGIRGVIDGKQYFLGRPDFVVKDAYQKQEGVVLADELGVLAVFKIKESIRSGASELMQELDRQGYKRLLMSGDGRERVSQVAARLNFGVAWKARQLPWEKLQQLETLKQEGHKVLMLGDGSNDAPVLAGADVSVSFASAAELAKSKADVLLCNEKLMDIVYLSDVSKQAKHILYQNKQWAFFYNMIAVPFAALGMVPPWLAAIGMSLSSLFVVMNAFRIGARRAQKEQKKDFQWV